MDLVALATAFGTIFVVELPDKTFIATLVLSTRYRPLAVWLGVGLAFGVQTAIAVAAGSVASLLPDTLVGGLTAAIFLLGAVVLIKTAPAAEVGEQEQEEKFASRAVQTGPRSGWRAVATSFVILFAAEWGDLSQLLTISMVTRFDATFSVFFGAWTALLVVSGLAVLVGRTLLRHLRLALLHYLGASVCLLLAGLTLYDVLV